jgi:hypothetical protein
VGGVLAEALEGPPRITDALRLLVHEALVELLLVHYTVLRGHEEYVRELEAGRDALLDSLEAQAPEALDSLTSEERHQWYKLLKLGLMSSPTGGWRSVGLGLRVVKLFVKRQRYHHQKLDEGEASLIPLLLVKLLEPLGE